MFRHSVTLIVALAGLINLAPAADVQIRLLRLTEVRRVSYAQPQDAQQVMITGDCEPGLTLELELVGETAGAATHYGNLKLTKAIDDQGRELEFRLTSAMNDPKTSFKPINRQMMFFGREEEGENKLLLDLTLDLPPRDAKQIREITGQVTLRTVTTEAVLIENIRSMSDERAEHPRLKNAGLAVTVFESQNPNSVKIEVRGDSDKLAGVTLVDQHDNRLNESSWVMGSGDTQTYELHGGKVLPATTRLKLNLITGRKDVPVNFTFKNLDLP